jgi:hypothetical protein
MEKTKQNLFYEKYLPIIRDSVKGTGLFPETVIAQMAIESNWGKSGLSSKHNNYFGIKGKGVNMASDEEIDGKKVSKNSDFRTYNSVEDSIKDYVKVLQTQGGGKTYKKVFEAKTPEAQAEALGNSPYATGSNYGSSIKSTITANKKYNMAEKTKELSTQEQYQKDKSKLDYYETVYGKDSKEYKDFKTKFDKGALESYKQKTKEKLQDYKSKIIQAEGDEDWAVAKKLREEYANYVDNNKFLEKRKTRQQLSSKKGHLDKSDPNVDKPIGIDDRIGEGFGDYDIVSSPDIDMDKIHQDYESVLKEEPVVTEDAPVEEVATETTETTGGTGTEEEVEEEVDLTGGLIFDKDGNISDVNPENPDLEGRAKATAQALEDFDKIQAEEFNFEYAPDNQSDSDVLGSLMDVGRGVIGMKGAMEEVPTYERGSMFSTAMDEAQLRRDEGLSADELNYRNKQAETAYAYNVKNIRRGVGGSAGAYLGNIQTAAAGLYDQYGQTAAVDEDLRRQNRANFQSMSLKDESINRQIFQDDLAQTMANKEAGAGLVQDAISNIKERNDYKKQYGKESPYYNFIRSMVKDTESKTDAREKGQKENVNKARRQLEYEAQQAKDAFEKSNNLKTSTEASNPAKPTAPTEEVVPSEADALPTNDGADALVQDALKDVEAQPSEAAAVGELETGGTVKKVSQDMVVKDKVVGDTKSLNSANIDAKIDEKRKQMEATEDDEEMMRLDTEIAELERKRKMGKGS